MDSSRVDLHHLRARLAKLGVHIEDPAPRPQEEAWEREADDAAAARHSSSKTVAQLLDRCKKVQRAINRSCAEEEEEAAASSRPPAAAAGRLAAAADGSGSGRRRDAKAALPPARQLPGAARAAAAAGRPTSARQPGAAAATSAAASAAADSKRLVRAAQQLLEDAQQDAQQVCTSLRGRHAAGGSSSARPSAAVAAAASVDDLRGSPLGTVLAQYKEAQAAWGQEKAKLRREAVAARKAAAAAQLEVAKLGRASQHQSMEASSLKAALKGRDVLLGELQERVRQLEGELAGCQDVAAGRLVAVTRERDDLQALLLATLERLEGVEAVVQQADATSAAMEDKVRVLEAERLAALQTAVAARQEVAQLQEARRRLQWQSELLEKMSEVQLRHNKNKSAAIRLLAQSRGDGGGSADSDEDCHKASAALQELLDELLEGGGGAASDSEEAEEHA